ncbi:MAG: ABC transporter substrate-binding protein [Pseudomonadota bacterium]
MQRWLLIFIAIISVLAATGPRAETPPDQLIVGMTLANVLHMDPHQGTPYEKTHILTQVYDRLVEMDPTDTSKLKPLLAESWTFDEDGNLTLKLREDAVFHSGNPVTAEDVVFSLRRALLTNMNAAGNWRSVGFTPENIEEHVNALDEHTIEIKRPADINLVILMYSVLAQAPGSILDKQLVLENEKDGDAGAEWLTNNAAASGRFTLNRWNPNEIVVLDRNDDHWMGPSEMRRIIVRHMPEAQTQRLSLEQGDIDLAYVLNASDYGALDENPDTEVQKVVGDGFYHIALNADPEHPILGHPEVRRAIRYVIPYDGLQESVMTYFGVPWHRPIAPGKLGATAADLEVSYDVDRAKELLAEAGFEDGVELEILTLAQPPFSEIATALQQGAAPAGIDINVVQGGGAQVYGNMRKRTFDMVVGRALGSRYGDPHSNVVNSMYNPDNGPDSSLQNYAWRASFQDDKLNELVEAGAAALDESERQAIYEEAQQRYEELSPPFHPIGQRIDPFAQRIEVEGVIGHPSWTTRWDLATKAQ